jgi:hypothetical protein
VLDDSPALVKEQEDILNTMIKGIRLFVLARSSQDTKPHPDLTTGLGTSVYTGEVAAPLLTNKYPGKLAYRLDLFTA